MLNAYLAGKKLLGGEYTQYTPSGKSLLAKKGRISIVPKVGDKVYFYSTTLNRVAHVGLVIEAHNMGSNYTITTIEGNTSFGKEFDRNGGMVAKKSYSFNLSEVGGYEPHQLFCYTDIWRGYLSGGGFCGCSKRRGRIY